jgi:phosphotransferase system HPr (HPr) family protein
MIETTITVNLKLGLHARPSAYIVSKLKVLQLNTAILTLNGKTADLRSILSVLTLFANAGDELRVVLEGPDEEIALKILEDIFNEKDNAVIYEGGG